MPWEIDVRKGVAVIGSIKRQGFTLMCDREKRLLAFHACEELDFYADALSRERPTDQFVISEDAFEPTF